MSKKVNKNEKAKGAKTTTSHSSSPITFGKVLLFFAILGCGVSYYAYKILTTPPDLPKYDVNAWWGSYPIDPKQDISIRPFQIEFSDVVVNDLKDRLLHSKSFTPPLENSAFTYGFNTNFLTQIIDYWRNSYNFKERERFLNKFNHYVTNIQGLDMHYVHVKPSVTDGIEVVPIILLHGWPGSIREFYEMIPKLTSPRPGNDFVFEVIAPSLPGFGFSQAPVRSGLGPVETAVMINNLMKRIGFQKYYIQGGDYGHSLGAVLSTIFPENVLGFHSNMPVAMHPLATFYVMLGYIWPGALDPEAETRLYPIGQHVAELIEESGYLHIQATKPDTIGVALSDSPAGLAAYILEKFSSWTDMSNKKSADGNLLKKFQLTHLLDNIMIYWVSNSITTSMRTYGEAISLRSMGMKVEHIPTEVPTWGIKFKHELMYMPDVILKLKYKNYLHSTVVDDGGHFAAMENPELMADDIFDAVEAFREFRSGVKQNAPQSTKKNIEPQTVYDFTVKDINGREIKLKKYKGYLLLIVNVASQCGLTEKNYDQLNELHEKYASRGLRILAFPCNQFGGQEPGTPKDILTFTKEKGVKFDIFEKIEVNGDNAHPLWKFLKETQSGTLGDFIKWNFSKFIVDRNGVPVERLGPNVDPMDLEPYLAKYW